MPVPTVDWIVNVRYPEEANIAPGQKLLYRIIKDITIPPVNADEDLRKHFMLICKAVLYAYDRSTKQVSENVLKRFFTETGVPKSLSPEAVRINHRDWDSVERLGIVYQGLRVKKALFFIRHKGERCVKYGFRYR